MPLTLTCNTQLKITRVSVMKLHKHT